MDAPRRPQRTIARETAVRGIGFLTGVDIEVRFRPAEADTGIVFVRTDLPDRPSVPALVQYVIPRQRRTTIQKGEAIVEMVEHVLAALAGLRIDNCVVEIDASETPGVDGSSRPFVEALLAAGAVEQDRPRGVLVVDQAVQVREGNASLAALPADPGRLILNYELDYGPGNRIGRQCFFTEVTPESFETELGPSRTFLLDAEAQALRAAGIGRRTTEADLLVFGPDGPINNTLRFPDECVRHKMLDLVGDLALLGRDLHGHVVARKSGHSLNAELVRKLLDGETKALARRNAPNPPTPPEPVMDISRIQEILPHRYPFLLVDRVLRIDGTKRIVALKNLSVNEPFFQGHWPGRPIMPGVLILEALAQAGGLLLAQEYDPRRYSALIVSISKARVRRSVVPGDQLHLEVSLERSKLRTVDLQGRARVGSVLAAEARIRFALVEVETSAA